MATAIIVVILILVAVFGIRSYTKTLKQGCCGSGNGETVKKVKVSDKDKSHYSYTRYLQIDGMVCKNCANRVENALNTLDGVWASIDLSTKTATVRMKQPIDERILRETVNHIGGYTVMNVSESK